MSRSVKKGPFVELSLLEKVEIMNRGGDKKVKKKHTKRASKKHECAANPLLNPECGVEGGAAWELDLAYILWGGSQKSAIAGVSLSLFVHLVFPPRVCKSELYAPIIPITLKSNRIKCILG